MKTFQEVSNYEIKEYEKKGYASYESIEDILSENCLKDESYYQDMMKDNNEDYLGEFFSLLINLKLIKDVIYVSCPGCKNELSFLVK